MAVSRNMVHVTMFVLGLLAAVAVTIAQPTNIANEKSTGTATESGQVASFRCRRDDTLPGRNQSPAKQCVTRRPGTVLGVCKNEHPDKWCPELKCASSRGDIPLEVKTGRALDGTWCGNKKMCLNGSCVDDTQQSNGTALDDFQYSCVEDNEFEISTRNP